MIGYLIREPGSGGLALDLPRWSKGATRYLLVGDMARQLKRRLPCEARFPTRGQVPSDGDTRKTARALLGGGDVLFSDTRFSPVVVELEGDAKVLYVIGPQAASSRRLDRRLPYGGTLFQLQVTRIVTVVTARSWRQLVTRHRAHITRAEVAIGRGEFTSAAAELGRWLEAVRRHLGVTAVRMQAFDEVARQQATLAQEGAFRSGHGSGGGDDEQIGRGCDRAVVAGYSFTQVGEDSSRVLEALRLCAESRHLRLSRSASGSNRSWAASRLRQLWQERLLLLSGDTARQLQLKIDGLEQQHGGKLREVGPPAPLAAAGEKGK